MGAGLSVLLSGLFQSGVPGIHRRSADTGRDSRGLDMARDDTEGVTFSGGEPFAHAAVLASVAEPVRAAGKSVVDFHRLHKGRAVEPDDL